MYTVFIALIFQSYHSPNPRIFLPGNMFIQVLAESQHARSMRTGEINEFRKRSREKRKAACLLSTPLSIFLPLDPNYLSHSSTVQEKLKSCSIIRSSRRGRGKQEVEAAPALSDLLEDRVAPEE